MAAAPPLKIYSSDNEYLASVKTLHYAVMFVSGVKGGTIRLGHSKRDIIWAEGVDGKAGDSYDAAAELAASRVPHRDDI